MTMRRMRKVVTLLALGGGLLIGAAPARACALDSRPSAFADGQRDRVNTQAPTTAGQLAAWTTFVFAHPYPARHHIVFTEDRREVALSLTAAAMRRPWRWGFGDGHTVDGWTVRHAYVRPGQWRITVDAYNPGTRRWYNFDVVTITVRR